MYRNKFIDNISKKNISIYDKIPINDPDLWIPTDELERIFNKTLIGFSLNGLALRTRSKVLKAKVCEILGYPIPNTFKKTNPRFPGQNFDTYIQKSNNLQIWNEELDIKRRYVIIKVTTDDIIEKIKVVNGSSLELLDTTGTLTRKYQARIITREKNAELITPSDTKNIQRLISQEVKYSNKSKPTDLPQINKLLSIEKIFEKLLKLLNYEFDDPGVDQERLRGQGLHQSVCNALGYTDYKDDGQFPDVTNQLLEIKLQTSPTIDLGLALPNSTEPIPDWPKIGDIVIRHSDVRYVIFYAKTNNLKVKLTHLYVTNGEKFFVRFPQFGGLVSNSKIQIPLPRNFFDV